MILMGFKILLKDFGIFMDFKGLKNERILMDFHLFKDFKGFQIIFK